MIWDFIKKYYIDSIVYKTGYNPVNTVTWAIILILAVYAIYKYLSKRVSFDERFFISNVPYILFGSFLRVVEDAGFLKPPVSYFFMSPFIYIVVFCIAFPSLLLSIKLRRENYWKHHFALGTILAVLTLTFLIVNLRIIHIEVLPTATAIATFTTALFYPLARFLKLDRLSISVFFSHMLDASATFYGITYLNYWELHVIPRLLINQFGAGVLIPTKFVVFTAILWILEREKDFQLKNFVKFVLLVLGLAPATRDVTRMVFYV